MGRTSKKTKDLEPVVRAPTRDTTVHGLYAKRSRRLMPPGLAPAVGSGGAALQWLYARHLSEEELMLLGEAPAESVEGEIALQRALIGRLAGVLANNGLGWSDAAELPEDTRKTMKLLNEAMGRLLGYVRMHANEMRRLNDPTGEIEAGKNLARTERNVFDYLTTQGDDTEDQTDAG